MSGGQRVPLSIGPGTGGAGFHAAPRAAAALQTQTPAVANVTLQQVLASAVTSFTITTAAFQNQGQHADVPFSNPLGLPNITLARGARGLVIVTLDLATQPTAMTVSFSRQLEYGGTSPQNTWTLPPGATFNGGKVVGVARLVALAAAAAQTLTVLCNAHVLGIPPAGGS